MSDNEYAVKFVRAKSDKIGALVQFHDSPMPYFLFYMVRERTGIARGACVPCLGRSRSVCELTRCCPPLRTPCVTERRDGRQGRGPEDAGAHEEHGGARCQGCVKTRCISAPLLSPVSAATLHRRSARACPFGTGDVTATRT